MSTDAPPRMITALGNPEFRALWAAEAQSIAGDQLTRVTLAILVYSRTNSALWAAGIYALTYLPALAGGLGLAQLADRLPRRTLLSTCAAIQACLVALMAIPAMPLAALCGLVVLVTLVGAPVNAAQNSLTRDVFTDDDAYLRSQDLRGITGNVVMLLGLACAGILVAVVGTSAALAVDAVTFAISAVVIRCGVRWRPPAGEPDAGWFGAARWVLGRRELRILLALSWLVGLAIVPEGLAAPLADEIGASHGAVGWLLAADPLGFIVGTFVLSHYVSTEYRKKLMGVLAVTAAAVLVLFVTEPSLPAALTLLALAGASGAYIVTVGATLITRIPNELRGGAAGMYRTGLRCAQGIGIALGGALAEWLDSASTAIALAGIAGVVLGVPVAYSWARLQRSPEHVTSAPTTGSRTG